jgi:hypothetical protein
MLCKKKIARYLEFMDESIVIDCYPPSLGDVEKFRSYESC